MSASGSGFPPSAPVEFSVGGVPAASSCLTNSSGGFGTAFCSFTVPSVLGGASTVVASTPWTAPSFATSRSGPTNLAYDRAHNELLVADQNSNDVGVFNASTGASVTNITVGNDPLGVAVDPDLGEIWVANGNDSTVSVINDTHDNVTDTIGLASGSRPGEVVYDAAQGVMFVSDILANNVSVINTTTLTVVGSISTESRPIGLVYVASLGQLFVVNAFGGCGTSTCGSVSVVSTSSDSVVANLSQIGANPYHASYDPRLGELYVENHASDNVSVLRVYSNASNDSVNASTPTGMGSGPADSTYDSATRETYVTDAGSNSVSVISDASNSVIATITGQSGANNVLYVPVLNATFISDSSSNTVTRVVPGASASSNFTVVVDQARLLLAPSSGPVGSTVSASGAGFQANSPVEFTVGGVPVASSCVTNATGGFSGSSCAFVVPSVPGGASSVAAINPWTAPAFATSGAGPTNLAFDAAHNELLVTDQGGAALDVFNASTGQSLTSISVGGSPLGVAVDPALGEIWVATGSGDTVSVINDTHDTVTQTITMYPGSRPGEVVYDAAQGEMFVSNILGGNVSVINTSTRSIVGSIYAQDRPTGLVYAASLDQLFVVNAFGSCGTSSCGSVSVLSASTGAYLTTLNQVGDNPVHASYDPQLGELYVENHASDNVSVLRVYANASNDSLIASSSTGVGSLPADSTYDSATGETYVTDAGTNSVSVISDASNSVLATITGQPGANNVLYVPALNATFITDSSSDTVTRVVPGAYGSSSFTVDAQLSAPASVEEGTSILLNGSGFGAGTSVSGLTFGATGLSCTYATVGTCLGGVIYTTGSGTYSAGVWLPSVATAGPYEINASDARGDRASITLSVYLGPSVTVPVATPSPGVLGQPVTFVVTASGGAPQGGYAYSWSGLPSGCVPENSAALTCTPVAVGTFAISADATDSNGITGTSPTLHFQVERTYVVTFAESGLPRGSAWGVVVGPLSQTSTSASLALSEPNGTYSFVVLAPEGWESNGSGSFTVGGADRSVNVTFTQLTYPVDFIVLGLPAGSNWSVSISNQTTGFNESKSTTGNALLLFLPNGTYTITFHLPPGYTGNVSSTEITVAGKEVRATDAATRAAASGSFWGAYSLYLVLAAVAVGGIAVAALSVRRRPPGEEFPRRDDAAMDGGPEPGPSSTPELARRPAGAPPEEAGGTPSADPLADVF